MVLICRQSAKGDDGGSEGQREEKAMHEKGVLLAQRNTPLTLFLELSKNHKS